MQKFANLTIKGWRQFQGINISFHPRLTIIAGANGAGKSTLLRILAQHFGFSYSLLATPRASEKSGIFEYISGLFNWGQREATNEVGEISYSNGIRTKLTVPQGGSISYQVQIAQMQPVDGLFIGSHRPTNNYQPIQSIPTNAISAQQAYQAYNQEIQNRYNNSYTQYSPVYRIKEAVISMATFGPGNRNVIGNVELERTYNEFKIILSKILPKSLKFTDISIRIPDVVIVTETGEFVIDAASGGLMALIDIAWQIFLYSRGRRNFTVLIDEPENHLHPSMQRTVIANLMDAFPESQFIVATHSPFIVSSVMDSSVYVLRYADGEFGEGLHSAVQSEQLDAVNKAGSANEILRSVLGVPVTMPLWVEEKIENIIQGFDIEKLDSNQIGVLRQRLSEVGLTEYYGDALSRMARQA